MFFTKKISLFLFTFLSVSALLNSLFAENLTVTKHKTDKERVDSIEVNLDKIEERAMSTLLNGASTPVAFSGDGRLKIQYHNATKYPPFMGIHQSDPGNSLVATDSDAKGNPVFSGDKSYLQAGWDEAMLRFGMVVKPGRNMVLWTRVGFSQTFAGSKYTHNNYIKANSKWTDAPKNTVGVTADHDSTWTFDDERHDTHGWSVNIFEDLSAGIAIRTVPASFMVKMGGVNWVESSPMTIWKGVPKHFAWDFLPYEEEQPTYQYYKYRMARGKEEGGRGAWHKKAYNGVNIETIALPAGININFLAGRYEAFDVFERSSLDFATEQGYAAEYPGNGSGVIIETGIGDSYRHIFNTRLSKKIKDLLLGYNLSIYHSSDDMIFAHSNGYYYFNTIFDISGTWDFTDSDTNFIPTWSTEAPDSNGVYSDIGEIYYKDPRAMSVDLNGNIGDKFSLHSDIGLSWLDTTYVKLSADMPLHYNGTVVDTGLYYDTPFKKKSVRNATSKPAFSFYTTLNYHSKFDLTADLIYAGEGFYSPGSFIAPMDGFFAFGSNQYGEGTFAGKTQCSPYIQNMVGVQLTLEPKLKGYGHFIMKYGQHSQINPGRDLLYIPWRLNGQDLNSMLIASYSRWGLGTYTGSYKGIYYRRLADESYDPAVARTNNGSYKTLRVADDGYAKAIEEGPEIGGLRADYMSIFENFVPFETKEQALFNYISNRSDFKSYDPLERYRKIDFSAPQFEDSLFNPSYVNEAGQVVPFNINKTSIESNATAWVPVHRKYTFNLEFDMGYDIGKLLGYKNDFLLSGYIAINGISTKFQPLAFGSKGDETLLWSTYIRFEPAIALTKKFYLLGLLGVENWRSEKAWMNVGTTATGHEDVNNIIIKRVPLDYRDYAFGLGFDWDALDRVTLHGRGRYMGHDDKQVQGNRLKAFILSLEVKTFF